ncbi:MAG: type II CRISPR RNA-guided endonuclease Cas9 [Bacteroidota bacterium]
MGKILGLDLGTNSIGWAVIEDERNFQSPSTTTLLKKGVHIFSEGVKIEKGNQSSKAAERTKFRSARRLKFRRKLRKYQTLKVLINHGMCPLDIAELEQWRSFKDPDSNKTKTFKLYPQSSNFLNWLKTDNQLEKDKSFSKVLRKQSIKNPYYFRDLTSRQKLLWKTVDEDAFILGRAFYHLAQRRGYLSNRFEITDDATFEDVKTQIRGEINNEHSIESLKSAIESIQSERVTQSDPYSEEEQIDKRIIKLFNTIEKNFTSTKKKRGKKKNLIDENLTIDQIRDNILKLLDRKENTGEVEQGIKDLSNEIEENNCTTIGQYFYKIYLENQKEGTEKQNIRKRYTAREKHYLKEFEHICKVQELDGINEAEELAEKRYSAIVLELYKAIFYQRPLKSQKGLVGKCSFEPSKSRCPISHPAFEESRALQFINNIKRWDIEKNVFVFLDEKQKGLIWPLFLRKSSPNFEFRDIAKTINPNYPRTEGKIEPDPNKRFFNYKGLHPVSGCPTISQLKNVFGENWEEAIYSRYTRKERFESKKQNRRTIKSKDEVITDIWHVLFTFDKKEKLRKFAEENLDCRNDTGKAKKFSDINIRRDYASLSLKAIKNILPYLREGYIFSHAVFLGNMQAVLGKENWSKEENRKLVSERLSAIIDTYSDEKRKINIVNDLIGRFNIDYSNAHKGYTLTEEDKVEVLKKVKETYGILSFGEKNKEKQLEIIKWIENVYQSQLRKKGNNKGEFITQKRLDEVIIEDLVKSFKEEHIHPEKLYHPSDIDIYPEQKPSDDGKIYLGSPVISSIKNPMAMRSLHQLRKLLNTLISEGTIDSETRIHIELARELNDMNQRKAIKRYDDERRDVRKQYKDDIKELYNAECGKTIEPTEDEILKYQLWKEQNKKCVYTGAVIGICDFIGEELKYDIEHTLPRGDSQDNSQMNKTLADIYYNRQIKGNKLPVELTNYDTENEFTLGGVKIRCNPIIKTIEHWETKAEEYEKLYYSRAKPKGLETKESKDRRIQEKHYFKMHWSYWKGKYERFTMKEIKTGFKNSQKVDVGIITKYARAYLSSVFFRVIAYKGELIDSFRKAWGLHKTYKDDLGRTHYKEKDRSNHIHHCVDAITIACITKDKYDILARSWELEDQNKKHEARAILEKSKAWKTFTEDVLAIENKVLISHHRPDNVKKQTKKKLRKGGKIFHTAIYEKDFSGNPIPVKGEKLTSETLKGMKEGIDYFSLSNKDTGEIFSYKFVINDKGEKVYKKVPIYQRGDTVRGSLHQDTFYGAIKKPHFRNGTFQKDDGGNVLFERDENGNILFEKDDKGKDVFYVLRKEISKLSESDIKNIVDPEVLKIFEKAIEDRVLTFKTVQNKKIAVLKDGQTIWRNERKKIPIKKVRCYAYPDKLIDIKEHKDKKASRAHKWYYHVQKDENYCMAIFEGRNEKGKIVRDCELVNWFDAGEYFKASNSLHRKQYPIVPESKNGLALKVIIKKGLMVLLYDKTPDELWELNDQQRLERLYEITGIDTEASCIKLLYHQEARESSEVTKHMGLKTGKKGGKHIGKYKEFPWIKVTPNDFDALVQGVDFQLNVAGELKKIEQRILTGNINIKE